MEQNVFYSRTSTLRIPKQSGSDISGTGGAFGRPAKQLIFATENSMFFSSKKLILQNVIIFFTEKWRGIFATSYWHYSFLILKSWDLTNFCEVNRRCLFCKDPSGLRKYKKNSRDFVDFRRRQSHCHKKPPPLSPKTTPPFSISPIRLIFCQGQSYPNLIKTVN